MVRGNRSRRLHSRWEYERAPPQRPPMVRRCRLGGRRVKGATGSIVSPISMMMAVEGSLVAGVRLRRVSFCGLILSRGDLSPSQTNVGWLPRLDRRVCVTAEDDQGLLLSYEWTQVDTTPFSKQGTRKITAPLYDSVQAGSCLLRQDEQGVRAEQVVASRLVHCCSFISSSFCCYRSRQHEVGNIRELPWITSPLWHAPIGLCAISL